MPTIYLTRHGIRLNNIQKLYNGHPDVPIHHSGIIKLLEESQKIEHIDYIFSSPFIRCVQTSHYLNTSDKPIIEWKQLNDNINR